MNEKKLDALVIDIDGTLSNCDHRRHFVTLADMWRSLGLTCLQCSEGDY